MNTILLAVYLLGVALSVLAFTKGSALFAKRSLIKFNQEAFETYGKESSLTYEDLKSHRGAFLIVLESLAWPLYLPIYYGVIALMYILIRLGE